MKRKIAILGSIVLLTSWGVKGQQGAAPPAAPPATPARPATPANPANPANPGQPGIQRQFPPGLVNGQQQPQQPSAAGGATNAFVVTNQFSFTNLPPTAKSGATNRVFGTNQFAFTNTFSVTNFTDGSGTMQDQALTATDRTLLVKVRQAVQTQVTSLSSSFSPVHFVVQQSAVTIVGSVATPQESQQVQAVVQTVPGVTQVMNRLAIRPVQDQAVTPADQALLTTVRTTLQPQISTLSTGPIPFRFLVRDGVVTVIGSVQNAEQRQQIENSVATVPGVVRVSNLLRVVPPLGGTPAAGTNFGRPQPGLFPTGSTNAPSSIFSTNQP